MIKQETYSRTTAKTTYKTITFNRYQIYVLKLCPKAINERANRKCYFVCRRSNREEIVSSISKRATSRDRVDSSAIYSTPSQKLPITRENAVSFSTLGIKVLSTQSRFSLISFKILFYFSCTIELL